MSCLQATGGWPIQAVLWLEWGHFDCYMHPAAIPQLDSADKGGRPGFFTNAWILEALS
jgi:hypothetical protein